MVGDYTMSNYFLTPEERTKYIQYIQRYATKKGRTYSDIINSKNDGQLLAVYNKIIAEEQNRHLVTAHKKNNTVIEFPKEMTEEEKRRERHEDFMFEDRAYLTPEELAMMEGEEISKTIDFEPEAEQTSFLKHG